jgi:4a-hydroxytetrahydrobiopterin dehydratase
MKKLSESEIKNKLKDLNGEWLLQPNTISREFKFENFIIAFSFMTSVAILVEKVNHHPNWENVYNKVTITLTTHDVNGISEKDFDLAEKIDNIYSNYK